MSSMYYVGTIDNDGDDAFRLNKPMELTGITASFIQDVLEFVGIDIYRDFNFVDSDSISPLFCRVALAYDGLVESKYRGVFEEDIMLCDVADEQYPVICDGCERQGLRVFIDKKSIRKLDLDSFKRVNLDRDEIRDIMSKSEYYSNNYNDSIVDNVCNAYEKLLIWLGESRTIYWYRDY